VRSIATVSALLLMTSSAFAEEAKKGMPQLDFANPLTMAQVVWLGLIFFTLYLLLSGWALPKVTKVLDARATSIAADLDAARAAKAKADEAKAEMMAAMAKAQADAQAQVTTAVDAAKAEASAAAAVASAKLETQLAAAETRIAAARSAAMGALQEVATTTTTDLVARLTGVTPNADVISSAVGHALSARAA